MSEEKINDLDKRIHALEFKLESKLSSSRFATSAFAFILAGAVILASIGYFDFRHIPNRIEAEINGQVGAAINSTIRTDFERLIGPNYEEILAGLGNIETGKVDIPHKRRQTGDQWQEVFREKVAFESNFKTQPQVFLSVTSIEAYHRSTTTTYRTSVEKLDRAGFELVVSSAYMDSFSNARIHWMAIDSVFRQLRSSE
ncbi:H-type lectin domain-containing protein [Hoeflea poritis]|uniref:H-type lectin domain-containing protein n=1 Tax=Hoeflea poritis TaxID=2993659 RepID=A0ABT4VHM7_9HYPH|nr:H-type lectin domain-containing protein [Hoeflea poritis]MDA4844187.1 hypothetical protein [Hoeflea poritis]